jgi:hypothetical protein
MSVAMGPMIVLPLVFLFVLLIILLGKAPRAGIWVVGGLILLAPLFFLRLGMAGVLSGVDGGPIFVLPVVFLFVLLVIVLAKAPKVGVGLVVALVIMAAAAFFVSFPVRHRRVAHEQPSDGLAVVRQDSPISRSVDAYDGARRIQSVNGPDSRPAAAPIWSEGVEDAFEADVYASKEAAVRAAGAHVYRSIPDLAGSGESGSSLQVVVFQQEKERNLVVELRHAIERTLPEAACTIEADRRNIRPGEVGVTLGFTQIDTEPAPWARSDGNKVARGKIEVNVFGAGGQAHIPARFIEKPWVEDFARFASEKPESAFVVARSRETCTSENEARELAIQDASAQLRRLIGKKWAVPGGEELHIGPYHLQEGDFIVDTFVQSLDGAAGKIWRQAMLIDASAAKLRWLDRSMSRATASVRLSLARMIGSAVGVIALIAGIYFFLNMATRGYYEWSLRIAGVLLAIVAVVSILMIVK